MPYRPAITEPFDAEAAIERRVREFALQLLRTDARIEWGHHHRQPVARLVEDRKHGGTRTLQVVSRQLAEDALAMLEAFEAEEPEPST